MNGWLAGGNVAEQGYVEMVEFPVSEDALFANSCGAQGRTGPTLEMCKAEYKGTPLADMLVSVEEGIQTFKISDAGVWKIQAMGARGGDAQLSSQYQGGAGAHVWSTFQMQPGDLIKVVVGQPGNYREGTGASSWGGAGGGGTFVWRAGQDMPLLVAGGGGGKILHSFCGCLCGLTNCLFLVAFRCIVCWHRQDLLGPAWTRLQARRQ